MKHKFNLIKGFTLIELLIVMLAIGILISIAYPGYKEYISKARRSDGQSALLDLAAKMERYYTENNTYQTATIGTGNNTDLAATNSSPERWYSLSIVNANGSSFTLAATPINAQTEDTRCQTLTLSSTGVKGIAAGPNGNPTGTIAQCW